MLQTVLCTKSKHTIYVQRRFLEIPAVYAIMWKTAEGLDRPQMKIRRMGIACWTHKVTNIHSEYVLFIVFPQQQLLYKHTLMLRYTLSVLFIIPV